MPSYEPQIAADSECPEPMHGLSRDAKKRWREVAPQLHASGVLRAIDTGVLAQYCESFAGWRKACRMIAKEGAVIREVNNKGTSTTKRNPWAAERDACHDRMQRTGAELGMTPSSRTKIVVLPTKKKGDESKDNFSFDGAPVVGKVGGAG